MREIILYTNTITLIQYPCLNYFSVYTAAFVLLGFADLTSPLVRNNLPSENNHFKKILTDQPPPKEARNFGMGMV